MIYKQSNISWLLAQVLLTHTSIIMQIVTGIEVNSEAYFPKLREYCPSAEGINRVPSALGQYSRNFGK